ncbi:type II toxin-antitoxin system HicA family toxin [Microcystis aeruginosa BLCCF158]|uniref:Type II toxin-antitoxin system HicA family toxin n=1 Tax=Microcystis aeruginosa BLCC-F158 TaxID=2755316 RepID=A0A841UZ91_MICAE|nr:type II toxin-antitoxin system HicA family toxin [Microcystis aeruginosa]MBC1194169.1 type II toxin-antitoxin system HicA family toxin [Microcystis aeruginosa BLCC-F158]
MALSKKQRKILDQIFEQPVRSDVVWTNIESLLEALGAEISEGRGSRVRVALSGVRAVFHRPHPRRETDKGAVVSVRRFLSEAGVENDEV